MSAAPHEDAITSPAWEGPDPDVSVIVPTHDRDAFLADVVGALEAQTCDRDRFEVIVVDDGSSDETWATLTTAANRTTLRMRAIRLRASQGPGAARNAGAAAARGRLLAFTDDDCLPTPAWLDALVRAFDDGADLVQGTTRPDPSAAGRSGPWDRTVTITAPTPLYESCNIAYRRDAFVRAGGFASERADVVRGTRPHFGEDVRLGWRVRAAGGRAGFAPDAIVHHRVMPSDFRGWLREQRRLVMFPALVRATPGMRSALWGRIFLGRSTAAVDLATASVIAAAVTRRPWLAAGVLPWIVVRWRAAGWRGGRSRFERLVQLGVGDAVGLISLLEGSVRARRPVL